jgi:hypothetical protein
MERLKNIDFKDLSVVTTQDAGMAGYKIQHKNYGTLIRIQHNDVRLLKAVETALYEEYGKNEDKK